jgi:hypothetical protein
LEAVHISAEEQVQIKGRAVGLLETKKLTGRESRRRSARIICSAFGQIGWMYTEDQKYTLEKRTMDVFNAQK